MQPSSDQHVGMGWRRGLHLPCIMEVWDERGTPPLVLWEGTGWRGEISPSTLCYGGDADAVWGEETSPPPHTMRMQGGGVQWGCRVGEGAATLTCLFCLFLDFDLRKSKENSIPIQTILVEYYHFWVLIGNFPTNCADSSHLLLSIRYLMLCWATTPLTEVDLANISLHNSNKKNETW